MQYARILNGLHGTTLALKYDNGTSEAVSLELPKQQTIIDMIRNHDDDEAVRMALHPERRSLTLLQRHPATICDQVGNLHYRTQDGTDYIVPPELIQGLTSALNDGRLTDKSMTRLVSRALQNCVPAQLIMLGNWMQHSTSEVTASGMLIAYKGLRPGGSSITKGEGTVTINGTTTAYGENDHLPHPIGSIVAIDFAKAHPSDNPCGYGLHVANMEDATKFTNVVSVKRHVVRTVFIDPADIISCPIYSWKMRVRRYQVISDVTQVV